MLHSLILEWMRTSIRLKRQKRQVKENFVPNVGQDLNTVIINIHILVNSIAQSVIFKRRKWTFV